MQRSICPAECAMALGVDLSDRVNLRELGSGETVEGVIPKSQPFSLPSSNSRIPAPTFRYLAEVAVTHQEDAASLPVRASFTSRVGLTYPGRCTNQ